MPLFVCDECECVENTATGFYWTRNSIYFKDESKNGKALCSECMPKEFDDGSINHSAGKWHNRFSKRKWDGKMKVLNRQPMPS